MAARKLSNSGSIARMPAALAQNRPNRKTAFNQHQPPR